MFAFCLFQVQGRYCIWLVPVHWTHGKPEDVGACCSLETVPHTEKTIMFLRPVAAWRLVLVLVLVIIISVCIQMSHTDTRHCSDHWHRHRVVSTLSNTGVPVTRGQETGARNASDSCLFSVRLGRRGPRQEPSSRGGKAANKRLGDTAEITDMLGKSRARRSGDGVLLTSSGHQSRPIKRGRSWVLGTKLKYVTNYPVTIIMMAAHCRLLGLDQQKYLFRCFNSSVEPDWRFRQWRLRRNLELSIY